MYEALGHMLGSHLNSLGGEVILIFDDYLKVLHELSLVWLLPAD